MKKYMAPALSELLELEDVLMNSDQDLDAGGNLGQEEGGDVEDPWNAD